MDRGKAQKLLSHVLGSYLARELDRKWLDHWMQSPLGRRLTGLSTEQRHVVEFVAYLASAFLVHNKPNPSAFRVFVNQMLTDIPPEIAARMTKEDGSLNSTHIKAVLLDITDDELGSVFAHRGEKKQSETPRKPPEQNATSTVKSWSDNINAAREKLRRREWRDKA